LADFCVHLGGDDAWEDIGWELGLIRVRDDVRVEELSVGPYQRDENHKRIYKGQLYADSDLHAMREWREKTKPGLLRKLSESHS
jgi:hypothetical protein